MRITSKQLQQFQGGKHKQSKYRASPTMYDGVRYASKAEALRALELDMMQAAGEIRWWISQPKFRLGVPENVYVADFLICNEDNMHRVEDVKGMRTPKFARDVKLWRRYGRLDLHIITRKNNGWQREVIAAGEAGGQ